MSALLMRDYPKTGKRTFREVKNLRWLLDHAAELHTINITQVRRLNGDVNTVMTAIGGGRLPWTFRTEWADPFLLGRWIRRPRFDGVYVCWVHADASVTNFPIDHYRQGYLCDQDGVNSKVGVLRAECRPDYSESPIAH